MSRLARSLAASVHGRLCAVPVCWIDPKDGDWGGDLVPKASSLTQNKNPCLAQLLSREQP